MRVCTLSPLTRDLAAGLRRLKLAAMRAHRPRRQPGLPCLAGMVHRMGEPRSSRPPPVRATPTWLKSSAHLGGGGWGRGRRGGRPVRGAGIGDDAGVGLDLGGAAAACGADGFPDGRWRP
jgi:hypothetical protein